MDWTWTWKAILTVVPVVGASVVVYLGAGEVASLRRETGDRSRLLAFLSLGRRARPPQREHHKAAG